MCSRLFASYSEQTTDFWFTARIYATGDGELVLCSDSHTQIKVISILHYIAIGKLTNRQIVHGDVEQKQTKERILRNREPHLLIPKLRFVFFLKLRPL